MDQSIDTLYQGLKQPNPFRFNEEVVPVFEDMIARSVPGYRMTLDMLAVIARQCSHMKPRCYDLGCSLGAASLVLQECLPVDGYIISVDSSPAMIEDFYKNIPKNDKKAKIGPICAKIQDVLIKNASIVVLNFTLQFIPKDERESLIQGIFEGMRDGGVLMLSEKIQCAGPDEDQFMISAHEQFKKNQGYSDLEISQKRTALDNVLIPESIETHQHRLQGSGFDKVYQWFQFCNFASFIAIK